MDDVNETWSAEAIEDHGERVSHLAPNHVFYAHLSIYDLAVQFCQDAVVLDMGCGAGYGSAYLADAGARFVYGVDISAKAIAFSKHYFSRENLEYREGSADDFKGFAPASFDFIYTSNVLEHVPDVQRFMRDAWRLLKPSGVMLIAVPPITDDRLEYLNLINPYHLNIWSPRQWFSVINAFFESVDPYLHGIEEIGQDFKPEHYAPEATLTEKGFVFRPGTIDEMYQMFTLTAIFVARKPRLEADLPAAHEQTVFVDHSYTRPEGYIPPEARARLGQYFPQVVQPSLKSYLQHGRNLWHTYGLSSLLKEAVRFAGRKLRPDR